jgi:Cu/Ag efflux protein CusF
MKLAATFLAALFATSLGIAHAESGMKGMDMMDGKKGDGTVHKATGKVTKVDPAQGSVTIAHGPVPSKNWPSMTMAFKAKDKAMLNKVKPGDEVQFSFVQSGKDHTITEIK